jgi:phosphotransferase system HPr (HPr) family protein
MNQEAAFRQTVVVRSRRLHLRPISRIVEVVRRWSGCRVTVKKGERAVSGDNVLDLMTLNAEHGTSLLLEANGDGAAQVIQEIVHLFETDFAENEEDESTSS